MGVRQNQLRWLGCGRFCATGLWWVLLVAWLMTWPQMRPSYSSAANVPGTSLQGAAPVPHPPTPGTQSKAAEDQRSGGANPMSAACGRELQQFCSGVQPGQGRLIECLNVRRSELSTGC